ncbi:hypothetical protein LTR37_007927 [Vermiconidia calcicola]|uniref:Uncharacterized protein n=1 Tax=Vermiconidia calcicola TaxID=1690605 RepID=A0ACC3NDY4_9PEZI|nr:hypothetical protein LTR37_007927 [Vermiconidia calcicola]
MSHPTIDLKAPSSYTVRLGKSVLQPSESKRWMSVRYNHTPKLNAPKDVKHTLKQTGGNREELTLRDAKAEYMYAGKNLSNDGGYYVLVSKQSGKNTEIVLERLGGCHEFNVTRTPSEHEVGKLEQQFPQLSVDDEDEDALFGDEDGTEEPVDTTNPWDYRKYLKPSASKARDNAQEEQRQTSRTPQPQPRAATSTPVSRPEKRSNGPMISQQKKRKAPADPTQDTVNHKRLKAGTEPASSTKAPAKSTRQKPDIPQVRIDRKASVRRPTVDDDSGELILENETPVSEKPPKQPSAMSLALSGQLLGQGPISLRSAASSPASRVASPGPIRPDGMEEGEEFELGGSDDEQDEGGHIGRVRDEEEDEDADADVEDLELPSPAQTHQKSGGNAAPADDDDDDDLDKALAEAMAEDEEDAGFGQRLPARLVDSDEEESEEE